MRLMNTSTGRFVWVQDPGSTRYAILSHVWSPSGEQSYHQVNALWRDAVTRANAEKRYGSKGRPSILVDPALSSKIRRACRIAREHGYKLLWIDSCCINQASSAELSEAINSMFEWYRKAAICYAYLEDVPYAQSGTISEPLETMLRKSKWHTRGWTLQELVAPRHVLFLTRRWTIIGSKSSMAKLLEDITGVDVAILIGSSTLDSVSVARRMSWASKRETTRVEDEAYSLLGILGVYMPTIYGEGRNAFVRLQQEIMKTIPDQSIFAWGPRYFPGGGWQPRARDHPSNAQGQASQWQSLVFANSYMQSPSPWGLLADSPAAFIQGGDVMTVSEEDFSTPIPSLPRRIRRLPDLHCSFTPQGARIDLLCLKSSASSFPGAAEDVVIALLRCRTVRNEPIGLILFPSTPGGDYMRTSRLDGSGRKAPLSVTGSSDEERRIIILPPVHAAPAWLQSPSVTSSLSVSVRTLDIKPIMNTVGQPTRGARSANMAPQEDRLRDVMVRIEPWCKKTLLAAGWLLSEVGSEPWNPSIRTSASALNFTIQSTGINNLEDRILKFPIEIRLSIRWAQNVVQFGRSEIVITASVQSYIFHFRSHNVCRSIMAPCINQEAGTASAKITINDTSSSNTVHVDFLLPIGPEWNTASFLVHCLRVTAHARVDTTLPVGHPRRCTLWHAVDLTQPTLYRPRRGLSGSVVPIADSAWKDADVHSFPFTMRRGEFIVPPPPSPTNSLPPPVVPIPVLSTLDSSATPGPGGSYAPDAPVINIYKGRRRRSILPAWISKWFR